MRIEKRIEERDACHFNAQIAFDGVTISCIIEDISEHGARLCFASSCALPATFVLGLPFTTETFDERVVELRWFDQRKAGVKFLKTAEAALAST